MITPFDFDQYQWLSRTKYPDGVLKPWNPDKNVIHWAGHTDPGDPNWSLEQMIAYEMAVLRRIQRDHIDGNKWFDIAYSYGVGNSGMGYRLRGENRAAATRGDIDKDGIPANEEARAFLWIGGLGYTISDAAYATMGRMLDTSKPVTLHHEYTATQCPGPDWTAWVRRSGWKATGKLILPPTGVHKMRTVRYGMGSKYKRDSAVAMLQRGMTMKGHPDKKTADKQCGADGIARSGTVEQIKDFQQAYGLVIDGIGGDATWAEADKE